MIYQFLAITLLFGTLFAERPDVKPRPRPQSHHHHSAPVSPASPKGLAEWTLAHYIQGDNNLDEYATINMLDMQKATLPDSVIVLVQRDKPEDNKTWRYRIVKGGMIEEGSLAIEMGTNPKQELIDMMTWVKKSHQANHYAVVLWNHGDGVLDRLVPGMILNSFLQIPGMPRPWDLAANEKDRGILYDDSQDTYLSNPDLAEAFKVIANTVLGKKVDIVGMDACLMAMLEVGYQIKDYAQYLVASQEVEAAEGWAYSGFLKPLCLNPTGYDAAKLASAMVTAYGNYYRPQASDYTQSAMKLDALSAVKENIDAMVTSLDACKKANASKTKAIVVAARKASVTFYGGDYIDLYSFYNALNMRAKVSRDQVVDDRAAKPDPYKTAVTALQKVLADGMKKIKLAVPSNVVGSAYKGAKGMSIYYPKNNNLHESYFDTYFAQSSRWPDMVKTYK